MSELDRFKRRLVRSVSRLLLRERRPDHEVWETLRKGTGKDCKELWNRMRTLTIKKLGRLLAANDYPAKVPSAARMTTTDWLMFDLALAHEDIDVVDQENKLGKYSDKNSPQWALMRLAMTFNVDSLAGERLAAAWLSISNNYNSCGRECSPMLLQKRWYQLKETARDKFYHFWQEWRGDFRQMQAAQILAPPPVLAVLVKCNPAVITMPFPTWEELKEQDKVISAEVMQAQFRESQKSRKAQSEKDNEPEVVLMEPKIPTIDLGADSDDDKKQDNLTSKNLENTLNIDKESLKLNVKAEPVEDPESNPEDCLANIQIVQTTHVPTEDLEKEDGSKTKVTLKTELDETITVTDTVIVGDVSRTTVKAEKDTTTFGGEILGTNVLLEDSENEDDLIIYEDTEKGNVLTEVNDSVNSREEGMPDEIVAAQIEYVDDGIEIMEDGDDGEYLNENLKADESKESSSSHASNENLAKFDLKLIMTPVVHTVKLEQMKTFNGKNIENINSQEIIKAILEESKPVSKKVTIEPEKNTSTASLSSDEKQIGDDIIKLVPEETGTKIKKEENSELIFNQDDPTISKLEEDTKSSHEEEETNSSDEEIERVSINQKMFKKPKITEYSPIQLCKNPDFNTRLKRLHVMFYAYESNMQYLKACKPVTIDLYKAFETKLHNNTIYLEPTVQVKKEVESCNELSNTINPSAQVDTQSERNEDNTNTNVTNAETPESITQPHSPIEKKPIIEECDITTENNANLSVKCIPNKENPNIKYMEIAINVNNSGTEKRTSNENLTVNRTNSLGSDNTRIHTTPHGPVRPRQTIAKKRTTVLPKNPWYVTGAYKGPLPSWMKTKPKSMMHPESLLTLDALYKMLTVCLNPESVPVITKPDETQTHPKKKKKKKNYFKNIPEESQSKFCCWIKEFYNTRMYGKLRAHPCIVFQRVCTCCCRRNESVPENSEENNDVEVAVPNKKSKNKRKASNDPEIQEIEDVTCTREENLKNKELNDQGNVSCTQDENLDIKELNEQATIPDASKTSEVSGAADDDKNNAETFDVSLIDVTEELRKHLTSESVTPNIITRIVPADQNRKTFSTNFSELNSQKYINTKFDKPAPDLSIVDPNETVNVCVQNLTSEAVTPNIITRIVPADQCRNISTFSINFSEVNSQKYINTKFDKPAPDLLTVDPNETVNVSVQNNIVLNSISDNSNAIQKQPVPEEPLFQIIIEAKTNESEETINPIKTYSENNTPKKTEPDCIVLSDDDDEPKIMKRPRGRPRKKAQEVQVPMLRQRSNNYVRNLSNFKDFVSASPFYVGKNKILLTTAKIPVEMYNNVCPLQSPPKIIPAPAAPLLEIPQGMKFVMNKNNELTCCIDTLQYEPEKLVNIPTIIEQVKQQLNCTSIPVIYSNSDIPKPLVAVGTENNDHSTTDNQLDSINQDVVINIDEDSCNNETNGTNEEEALTNCEETKIDKEQEDSTVADKKSKDPEQTNCFETDADTGETSMSIGNEDQMNEAGIDEVPKTGNIEDKEVTGIIGNQEVTGQPGEKEEKGSSEDKEEKGSSEDKEENDSLSKALSESNRTNRPLLKIKDFATVKEDGPAPSKKTILSDLMEMSGISADDTQLEPSPVPSDTPIPPVPTDTAPLLTPVSDSNVPLLVPAIDPSSYKMVLQSLEGSNQLSQVTSIAILKYARAQNAQFFRLNLLTGEIVSTEVSIIQKNTTKFKMPKNAVIVDLTKPNKEVVEVHSRSKTGKAARQSHVLVPTTAGPSLRRNPSIFRQMANVRKETHKRYLNKLRSLLKNNNPKTNQNQPKIFKVIRKSGKNTFEPRIDTTVADMQEEYLCSSAVDLPSRYKSPAPRSYSLLKPIKSPIIINKLLNDGDKKSNPESETIRAIPEKRAHVSDSTDESDDEPLAKKVSRKNGDTGQAVEQESDEDDTVDTGMNSSFSIEGLIDEIMSDEEDCILGP